MSISVFTIGLVIQPAVGLASSLELHIDSPTKRYTNIGQSEFKLRVTFSNTSTKPLVVFPYLVRRKYVPLNGQSAKYLPYPGPRIDPWFSAISLAAGEKRTITYKGMKDGDGKWGLEPGRYKLSVTLDLLNSSYYPSIMNSAHYRLRLRKERIDVDVWQGSVVSNSISINYLNQNN